MTNIKTWADPRLVTHWQRFDNEFRATIVNTPADLQRFAVDNGFLSWSQMRDFLMERKAALERLITHEDARFAWNWIASGPLGDELIVRVWRSFETALERWCKNPKLTNAEYCKELSEISSLSRRLAGKLAKHYGSHAVTQSYSALLSDDSKSVLESILHPDLVEMLKSRNNHPVAVFNQVLPPLHVLLLSLSKIATETSPPNRASALA